MKYFSFILLFLILITIPDRVCSQNTVSATSGCKYVCIKPGQMNINKSANQSNSGYVKIQPFNIDDFNRSKTVALSETVRVSIGVEEHVPAEIAVVHDEKVAQEISKNLEKAESKIKEATIKEKPSKIEYKYPNIKVLDNSIQFQDQSGDKAITAFEKSSILLKVANKGELKAQDLNLKVENMSEIEGLVFAENTVVDPIDVEEEREIEIQIVGGENLTPGIAKLRIEVEEGMGFGSDPVFIEFNTSTKANPFVRIVDYHVSSRSNNTI